MVTTKNTNLLLLPLDLVLIVHLPFLFWFVQFILIFNLGLLDFGWILDLLLFLLGCFG